ncbi:MAG: M23 family metallopeptidase [Betaproteobacteria bacterium AqS2]|uniref:M23 family metallopeptidase n=1 Tax=Candidatus Amphirhobacter heronislandensis TaxID=1732024 RepID=A0A930UF51_9GAMM|nr:M23 family metallopeptidase [Betaproteobacteria bacterium AqS2]
MPLPRLPRQLRDHLAEQAQSLWALGFVLAAALFSLALAPAQEEASGFEAYFEDLLAEPDYGPAYPSAYAPQERPLALDLPFAEEDAAAAAAAEPPVPAAEKEEWLSYTIARRDTLGGILRKIKADDEAFAYLVTLRMQSYNKLHPRKQIDYRMDDAGRLAALRYKLSPELHFNFVRSPDGTMSASEDVPQLASRRVSGLAAITPDTPSIYQAFVNAGIPDLMINKVADVLETRVDFVREIRDGDSIAIYYEQLYDADGDYAGPGQLYGVHLINQGVSKIGLLNPADGSYYTEKGENSQRAFLLSPLKFTRISSRYSLRRFHPVLKKWRAHRGVDFAAPTGTPIRATGDGVIEFVGTKGGYGKVVSIRHYGGKYTTLYAHMSRYAQGMRGGVQVLQGDVIGYVGSTGLSTGPHLHYEFRIDGVHVDPLSAKVPVVKPSLTAEQLRAFATATAEAQRALGIEVTIEEAAAAAGEEG